MNWLFSWIKLIDKVTFRYRKWTCMAMQGKPYPADASFKREYKVNSFDDKKLVYDISLHFIEVLLYFCVAVVGVLFLILFISFLVHSVYQISDFNFLSAFDEDPRSQPLSVHVFLTIVFGFFFFFIFPTSTIGLIYPFLRPKERLVIFDRENQTVTIPQRFWGQCSVTVAYNEFKICAQQDYGAAMGQIRLFAYRPNDGHAVRIGKNDAVMERVLLSWYMRLDSELPEGELLDPYREKDNQRIRAQFGDRRSVTLEVLESIPNYTEL